MSSAGTRCPLPGWRSAPPPRLLAQVPYLPDEAAWIEAIRRPVLMDTTRARRRLHWMPHHDARQTLRQTVAAARRKK